MRNQAFFRRYLDNAKEGDDPTILILLLDEIEEWDHHVDLLISHLFEDIQTTWCAGGETEANRRFRAKLIYWHQDCPTISSPVAAINQLKYLQHTASLYQEQIPRISGEHETEAISIASGPLNTLTFCHGNGALTVHLPHLLLDTNGQPSFHTTRITLNRAASPFDWTLTLEPRHPTPVAHLHPVHPEDQDGHVSATLKRHISALYPRARKTTNEEPNTARRREAVGL